MNARRTDGNIVKCWHFLRRSMAYDCTALGSSPSPSILFEIGFHCVSWWLWTWNSLLQPPEGITPNSFSFVMSAHFHNKTYGRCLCWEGFRRPQKTLNTKGCALSGAVETSKTPGSVSDFQDAANDATFCHSAEQVNPTRTILFRHKHSQEVKNMWAADTLVTIIRYARSAM